MPQCNPQARRNTIEIAQEGSWMLPHGGIPYASSGSCSTSQCDCGRVKESRKMRTRIAVFFCPKGSPNLSKIDPGWGLEATWAPTLKAPFRALWAPLFETLSKMRNARKPQYLLWFSHIGDLQKLTWLFTFGIIFQCFLKALFEDGFGTTFCRFGLALAGILEQAFLTFQIHFSKFWKTCGNHRE